MKTKQAQGVTIKSADEGKVTAAFSQFNVIDHDGDVTMPDALTDGQKIRVSAFNHGSWQGALPVGKGEIRVDGDYAFADMEFFIDTPHGKAHFDTVKNLGDLMEWSYSLHNIISDRGTFEDQPANILRKIDVHEVSPVLKGAGIGTHTVDIKSDGMKFSEHAAAVLIAVDELVERATEVVTLRAEQGKALSPETAAVLADIEKAARRLPSDPPEEDITPPSGQLTDANKAFAALLRPTPAKDPS